MSMYVASVLNDVLHRIAQLRMRAGTDRPTDDEIETALRRLTESNRPLFVWFQGILFRALYGRDTTATS